MPIEVKVLSAADYSTWVDGERKKLAGVPAGPDTASEPLVDAGTSRS